MWNFPEVVGDEFVQLNLNVPAFRKPSDRPDRRQTELAKYLHDSWADNPAVVANFGGVDVFHQTVDKIDALDECFQSIGGGYLHLGYFHLGGSPVETLENFAETQLQYWQTGVRPILPGQVAHYLDQIAMSKEDPYYKAAVLVAVRAELEHASRPEYHGLCHTSDVIAATMEFLKKNNALSVQRIPRAIKLSRHELAIGIIAAAGHDVGHPGGKNSLPGEKKAPDPFRLERKSIEIIEPLLEVAGIPAESLARIKAAILATSPDLNGPCKLFKELGRLHDAGEPIQWQKLPDHKTFSELRLLADDPALRAISQNLRCADLSQSCMFGLRSNEIATRALQAEWRNRGYDDQLIGDAIAGDRVVIPNGQTIKARQKFLDFVAYGEAGPDAAGAKAAAGSNYADLCADTKAKFEAVRIEEKTHAVLSICFDPVTSRLS